MPQTSKTRELQESNEELQQFAYVASHDLQEPLRTITSFSQLLEANYKGKLGEDADEFIGFIVSSSRRMTDLINGLLSLIRLRKTGQPVAPVSFEKLLDDAEVSLQAAIRESGARIDKPAKRTKEYRPQIRRWENQNLLECLPPWSRWRVHDPARRIARGF